MKVAANDPGRGAVRSAEVLFLLAVASLGACGAPEQEAADEPAPAERTDWRLAVAPETSSAQERERVQRFWAIYRRANAERVAGDHLAALTLLDSALALHPEHLDALYYSGNACFELGRFDEAERRWRKELSINAHAARTHAQLGRLYAGGFEGAPFDPVKAQGELESAHALNRAETGPLVLLGTVALLRADHAQAERWLAAASRTNLRSVAAVFLRGYLAWSAGDGQTAQRLLDEAHHLARGGPAEASASAEGQTRRGNRPLLEGRRSAVEEHWRRLGDVVEPPDAEATFVAFGEALKRLQSRVADASD